MRRILRRILWRFLKLTDPPGSNRTRPALRPPGPRTIPLPAGTPRHTTVKMPEHAPRPQPSAELWPGSKPPEVRRS
jgi:hypothetical protein